MSNFISIYSKEVCLPYKSKSQYLLLIYLLALERAYILGFFTKHYKK